MCKLRYSLFAAILFFRVVLYGLAVRIPDFHPGGPRSTYVMGITNLFFSHQMTVIRYFILRLSEDSGSYKKSEIINASLSASITDLLNIFRWVKWRCKVILPVADPDLELRGGGGGGLDLLALSAIFPSVIFSFFTPGPSPRSATVY